MSRKNSDMAREILGALGVGLPSFSYILGGFFGPSDNLLFAGFSDYPDILRALNLIKILLYSVGYVCPRACGLSGGSWSEIMEGLRENRREITPEILLYSVGYVCPRSPRMRNRGKNGGRTSTF